METNGNDFGSAPSSQHGGQSSRIPLLCAESYTALQLQVHSNPEHG